MDTRIGHVFMEEFIDIINEYIPKYEIRCIVDIGCKDCADTIILQNAFPQAQAIGLEGSKLTWDRYKLSEMSKVRAIQSAISYCAKTTTYYQQGENDGASGLLSNMNKVADFEVETLTIRQLWEEHENLLPPDVVKIDCEGTTFDVLIGFGEKMLNNVKIMHIETEKFPFPYFPGQVFDTTIAMFLTANGFQCLAKREVAENNGQHDEIWINSRYI